MTLPGPILAAQTWLLPFAVAAAAFGLHYALHVPPGPLPPPSPQKLEDERKAADKKKRDDDRKKREEDRKAGKKPKVERGARELPYEAFTLARKQHLLDQLWAYYEPEDFKKEPTFDAWQTAHKPLLAQIVQNARQIGFAEPPPTSVIGSECHTIRCRFQLTGSEADLDAVIPVLEGLKLGDGPLWHSFKADEPAPDKKDTAGRYKAQITVSFTRDLPPMAEIHIPGKGPLSAAKPPPTPTPSPSTVPPTAPSKSTIPGAASARTPSGAPAPTAPTAPPIPG